ncbi:HNH endonuclease [Clostridium saccharobutylicum]|uniref:HNH endonuclease n=1 Tax=Clostridium saccharobutylicum DSM 13864 TaxID=1345695 RepID=U5MNL8_CLOSA|nr:HNH endonuclease [Clostridium saccharobutylicum]AGX42190.1 HNH endonuclease [Clostridium saccharobutylicum DSM 13864]AQR89470.1 hypothetical protein CLOSC_11730 [Clostridium saccharobutylicum]AQR99372.1 hypothetical protein CSACC_11810 [Clostridium saccharobutylicum]AQS09103.1 hypothetical protein CLOBY_12260 [Clostridium saccharobutylicum]AQS13358.1 hypothetical protein CLOSACC_11810 [Clostridium saccharobutylicum]
MNDSLIPVWDKSLEKNKIRYFTKELLIESNRAAIREKRNRKFSEEYLYTLEDDKPYIVADSSFHKKDEMRVLIAFNGYDYDYLDMSLLRFNSLPIGTVSDDNCIIPEDPTITEEKRPYSAGREWEEKVVKKPVRKQYNFRKEVLSAYSNQCAVCTVNIPKILRAAHIIPVVNSSDDTVNNGICLCINHEVLFDSNDLKITPNYEIVIKENSNIKVEFNKIRLPQNLEDYPSKENLTKRYYNK